MAYSTVAELRAWFPKITTSQLSDLSVTAIIGNADKTIKKDLSKIIDFSLVPALSSDVNFPPFIGLLSQYKTCELVLRTLFSSARKGSEQNDIDSWSNLYKNDIQEIRDEKIKLELVDGTSIDVRGSFSCNKVGVEPALGVGAYGEFIDEDDLEDERPID